MKELSRRTFLSTVALAAAAAMADRRLWANPLGLPLGLQLYSVRQQMAQDLDSTLAGVAAAGYTEVEAASLPQKPASVIRAALDKAGLHCVSAHHPFSDLKTGLADRLAFDKELGCTYMICSSPGRRVPVNSASGPMTLDDWSYCAEQFNRFGEEAAAAGLQFGYHNHVPEFAVTDGKVPYLELLRLTTPKLVTMELDCGWATVAGMDPVALLRDHPNRIQMLHVKDFTMPQSAPAGEHKNPPVTELGKGSINYAPIFAQAAKTQHITHAFVEQEAFDMPWEESLKVDAAYMKALNVPR